jgi:fructokinase
VILVIGEILIDIFPDYARIGGAPFNFAFHLKQLGFPVRFFTRVGEDREGRRILERLKTAGFDLTDVQIDPYHPTGTVGVELDDQGVPRFDIRGDVAYDYIDLTDVAIDNDVQLIYFGSLVQRIDAGRSQVQNLLARRKKSTIGFCDINLRPPHINARAVVESLHHADLLKLNEEELAAIGEMHNDVPAGDNRLSWLTAQFDIHTVALTLGSRGSLLRHGDTEIKIPAGKSATVVDTVGAGDGYAAILAAGFLLELPWKKTVALASRFASRICGFPGAVPDDPGFYDDWKSLMEGNHHDR